MVDTLFPAACDLLKVLWPEVGLDDHLVFA